MKDGGLQSNPFLFKAAAYGWRAIVCFEISSVVKEVSL